MHLLSDILRCINALQSSSSVYCHPASCSILVPSLLQAASLSNRNWVVSLRQRDVSDLNILVTPLVEELNTSNLINNILWEDWVVLCNLLNILNLGSLVVRHDCDLICWYVLVERGLSSLGELSIRKLDCLSSWVVTIKKSSLENRGVAPLEWANRG